MKEEVKKYLPEHISLYYIDYSSDLKHSPNLIQKCIDANDFSAIDEFVYDWFDNPTGYYVDNIRHEMRKDNCEELLDECLDEVVDYLYEHDTSDPVSDLLRNTGDLTFFYDVGVECDHGWHSDFLCSPWRNESIAQTAYKIRRKLGIEKDSQQDKQIRSVLENSYYGGFLRIYFRARLNDLINDSEFDTIKFKGKVALAVYNPQEGAGDFEFIEVDCALPFNRENLAVSESDRYSIEKTFGMFSGWCQEGSKPIFAKAPKLKRKVKLKYKSPAYEMRKQEQKYKDTFKAGGCTFGDTNISRHRDVYYRNDLPCGLKCPHCGQFWID